MSDYEDDIGLWNWGPEWRAIDYVLREQVPALDEKRALAVSHKTVPPARSAVAREHAFRVARNAGRMTEVVSASEDLRRAAWQEVYTASQATAWMVSWELANLGIGLATYDLIDEEYTIEDYLALVSPWADAFSDMPVPR
jgi:hypothetical protein